MREGLWYNIPIVNANLHRATQRVQLIVGALLHALSVRTASGHSSVQPLAAHQTGAGLS